MLACKSDHSDTTEQSSMTMTKNLHILGLNGIRALAVIGVVIAHLHGLVYLQERNWLPSAVIPMIDGGAGVQAFFVLSGFLITTLLIREHRASGSISIRRFYCRRALRIFPVYYLFLIIATILYLIDNRITSVGSLLYGYFYAYNFIDESRYTLFMGHIWSLAVEEHFYLLWPAAFLVAYPIRLRPMYYLLFAAPIVSLLLHAILVRSNIASSYFVGRWTFIAGYSIVIGCIVALLLESNDPKWNIRKFLGAKITLAMSVLVYSAPAIFFGRSWIFDNVISPYFRCLGLALVIAWVVCRQDSLLTRALELPPLRYLGKISYGVYMYQGLFLATGPHREPGHLWPPSPLIGLCLLIVVPPLSYRYFERPFMEIKERFGAIRSE
jgi:peptidoglycan/LPS O-acetylase OafA/YrhL